MVDLEIFFSLSFHYTSLMADPPLMRKIKFIKKTMGLTYNLDPTQRGERERQRDRDRQRLREMGKTEKRNERRGREEGEGK